MKKNKILIFFLCFSLCSVTALALTSKFNFDQSKLSFTNSKKSTLVSNFAAEYKLSHSLEGENKETIELIENLTKKTTQLLIGDFNNSNESSENYYKRRNDFRNLASYKYFPKNKETESGYDESDPVFKYVTIAEFSLPQLFLKINELDINYSSYGDIRVTINDKLVISTLILPNVKMKKEYEENSFDYKIIKTNLIITYYFIKIDGQYRLTYLYGDTTENLSKYFNEVEVAENKNSMAPPSSYESDLTSIYNFNRLKSLSNDKINNVYNDNIKNVVNLTSYYNNKVTSNGNGVFINDGIVLTTWSYVEDSLEMAQYITIKDGTGTIYAMDGVITANPATDVALIKVKEKNDSHVKLGSMEKVSIEDPAIVITSKSGLGYNIQKGIIISNGDYIQTSIPLSKADEGSPLFNEDGLLIGLNTSKSINNGISISINTNVIKEIQDKFNNIDFETLKYISFDKLKSDYYYTKISEENIVNNIPKNIWKIYSKIGDIENNIKLKLVKSNYEDNVVSLRYKNNASDYIDGIKFTNSFKYKLLEEGFKEKLNSPDKMVYESAKYRVIIMEELDYLIILMVKL